MKNLLSLFTRETKSNSIPKKNLKLSVTYSNTEHFRGFKRIQIASYGIVDPPEEMPETKGKTVRIDLLTSEKGELYCDVFLDDKRIGCLFQESVDLFQKPGFDQVHIEFREVLGADGKTFLRPKMLAHLREEVRL